MIPDREKCLQILKDLNVPQNIIGHSKRITKVALFIGKHFPEKIDLKLLEAACLLHDICKIDEINGIIKDHGIAAAEKVRQMGHEELYLHIPRHRLSCLLKEDFHNWDIESIILIYADTVDVSSEDFQTGKIKTIKQAFERYYKRYPQSSEQFKKEEPILKEIEKYLFEKTGLCSEDLQKLNE